MFAVFRVQTQLYNTPTYGTFRNLANASAGIAGCNAGKSDEGGTGSSNAQFKQRDKNRDGQLDLDELPTALFNRLDTDDNGFVTGEEATKLIQDRN